MTKTFFLVPLLSLLLLSALLPKGSALAEGQGLVSGCGEYGCTDLDQLTEIPCKIVTFLKEKIAVPAAVLFFIIGGLMILFSAGNPQLAGLGKKVLIATVIGMFLIFGANAIVNMIAGQDGCRGVSGGAP